MTRAGASAGPFREKLANYVASPPAGRYTFFQNHIEKLISMMTLGEYDLSRGSTDPDIELVVRSGDLSLLEVRSASTVLGCRRFVLVSLRSKPNSARIMVMQRQYGILCSFITQCDTDTLPLARLFLPDLAERILLFMGIGVFVAF